MNSKPEDWYLIQSCRLFFRRWTPIITVCGLFNQSGPSAFSHHRGDGGVPCWRLYTVLVSVGSSNWRGKTGRGEWTIWIKYDYQFFFSVLMLLFFCHLYILLLATFYSIDLARFRTDFSQLIPCQLNTQNVNLYQKYTFVYS